VSDSTIGVFETEERTFPPSSAFVSQANTNTSALYDEANADFEAFWARQARELLTWDQDFTEILEWKLPDAKWFADGKLNVSANCLDRHVANGLGDKVAYHWEGEPGDTISITYAELLTEVSKFANVLKGLGVEKGDRVAIYMPMILELPIAMLACTRIGAAHSVIFGGFSADAIVDRCVDAEAKVIVTVMHTTGGYLTQVAFTHKYVFDLKPETDIYWCAADIGWVTGHSYIVYGPLANGCTSVMYEGDVVPRTHRRRANPDCGYLVADRDRRQHDHPTARCHHHQAGLGLSSDSGSLRRAGG